MVREGTLTREFLTQRAQWTLDWLSLAYEKSTRQGISHSYSFWLNPNDGWLQAYPETTGYIIPTLLKFGKTLDERYIRLAEKCGDWLMSIQDEAGWFYAGTKKTNGPSVFNTGMILLGFLELHKHNQSQKVANAAIRAAKWIVEVGENGRWNQFLYRDGFLPIYYVRVLWPLSQATNALELGVEDFVNQGYQYFKSRLEAEGLTNAGFSRGDPVFLHTIAYTFRGLYETAPDSDEKNQIVAQLGKVGCCYPLSSEWDEKGILPGAIRKQGPDYSFECLTGMAQMSVLYRRIFENSESASFSAAARKTLTQVLKRQYIGTNRNRRGALAGSHPFWGPYNRLRYPNWAAKFLLDAIHCHL